MLDTNIILSIAVLHLEKDHSGHSPHPLALDLCTCPCPNAKARQHPNPPAPRPPAAAAASGLLRPPPPWKICSGIPSPPVPRATPGSALGRSGCTRQRTFSSALVPPSPGWRAHWGCFPTCPRFLPFLLPPKASPWYVPVDRLEACRGASPPREDLMELSLARELPSCELSTISTAASRSRQREESLPRIHAAISGRGVPGREAQSPRDPDAGEGGPDTGPLTGGAEARRLRSPIPLGCGGPAPCELSPTPQTRS